MTATWRDFAIAAFEQPPGPRWATPLDLAQHLEPKTVRTPMLELLNRELVELLHTPDGRLTASVAPQEGKTQLASKTFPLWALIQNPELRIAIVSYEHNVARRISRAIRDWVTVHGADLGLAIRQDVSAQNEWQLDGHGGGVYSTGIGGALTGRPVDCVSADTYITTDRGEITAAEAFRLGITRVLAYDHTADRAVWRDVEAARRIPGRRVVDVVTQSGRVLTCTPDHRVSTGRGYVPAGSLRPGDALVALVGARGVQVRESARGAEDGRPQGRSAGPGALLLSGLHGDRASGGESHQVLRVRSADTAQPAVVLLDHLHGGATPAPDAGLPAVQHGVSAEVVADCALLPSVRERSALGTNGGAGQLALQDGHQLRALVSVDAPVDPGAGRALLCGLPEGSDGDVRARREDGHAVESGDSPHRRGRQEQPAAEPDHAVRDVPHRASQVETDTVAVVRHRGDETVDVFDFQVAGTRNFFGSGVLVHNCMIIDDPVKDREQADSETYRERAWDWWLEVGATRLAPGAPVAVIATRWHEADLIGRLLKAEDGASWRVVNVPAQADHDPTKGETDPLDREPGQYMVSARGRTRAQWEAIKTRSGSRTWNALYQGRPAPAEGALFKRDQWRRYDRPLWIVRDDGSYWVPTSAGDEIAMSWDMAFRDTDGSDYVVGTVWLRRGVQLFLLDMVRRRMSFTDTVAAVKALAAKWPQALAKFVEAKANGDAVINLLSRSVPGLIPVEPEGGKIARANAASPFVEAGNVWLPEAELLPIVEELVEEAAAFPNGAHDDAVDTFTQAVNRMLINPLLFAGQDDDVDWQDVDDEMAIARY